MQRDRIFRKALFAVAIAVSAQVFAQSTPTEFEGDRLPTLKTGGNCLVKGGRVFTITHGVLDGTDVLIQGGKIMQIGKNLSAPAGTTVLDASGLNVFPGFIDAHSHRGQDDTNESGDAISAETNIRDVLNPTLSSVYYYLADGITAALGLHGSANAIGGQSVVFKSKYMTTPEQMIFTEAPPMIKFALGENPKGSFDPNNTRFPVSRMGVEAVIRRALDDGRAYMKLWDDYKKNPKGVPPRKDLRLEAIAGILRREIWVQCHSYRQDEMLMLVRLSQEYGFKVGTMQHALEGYKIAPELAAARVPASVFSQAWSYKMEVYDSIPMATSILIRAGVITSVNTDSFSGVPPLTLEAAVAMRYGISENDALKQLTINPAIQLGVDRYVGSIDVGKQGDLTIWKGHPLSVYSRCQMTLVDGELRYTRRDPFGVDGATKFANDVRTTQLTADLDPLPAAGSLYAIVGGTVHPVSGPDIQNGTVIIRDGKIEAVGKVAVPKGAIVVEAHGQHVYPGFIDCGSNLGINEIGQIGATVDTGESGPYQPDLRALIAVNPESLHIPVTRSFGVTTALVKPGRATIAGQGAVMNLAGYNREQMEVRNSRERTEMNPQPGATLQVEFPESPSYTALATARPSAKDEIVGAVTDARRNLREYFEKAKRYDDLRKTDATSPIDTRLEAMRPYLAGERPVVFQANSPPTIRAAIAFAKEIGVKPIIGGGAEAWKIADELAKQSIPVLYSPPGTNSLATTQGASEFDPWDAQLCAPYVMWKAGVKFAFESDESAMAFNLPQQAGYTVGFGLPHEEAIKALTMNAASILGLGDKLGSLEPGKMANVIVTNGDPLEMTAHVQRLFIAGKPVSLKNHFTELYRKYEARLKR